MDECDYCGDIDEVEEMPDGAMVCAICEDGVSCTLSDEAERAHERRQMGIEC